MQEARRMRDSIRAAAPLPPKVARFQLCPHETVTGDLRRQPANARLEKQNTFSAVRNYDFDINGDSMRKFLVITAGLSLLAAATINISDASAKWGCYAKNRTDGWGGSYGQDSKERAVELAIRSCKEANPTEAHCSLTGCDSDINAEADMDKKWKPATPVKVRCGAGADKAC